MSMVKCAECKKRVSDRALQCPKCGATSEAMLAKPKTNWGGLAMLCGFLILVTMAVTTNPTHSAAHSANATLSTSQSTGNEGFRQIAIQSDPSAKYWVTSITSAPSDPIALISSKRVGTSGESHNMRIYNCDNSEVAYLRDEHDSHETLMAAPNYDYAKLDWAPLLRKSIASELGRYACSDRLAK